jgi:hypothetical protein
MTLSPVAMPLTYFNPTLLATAQGQLAALGFAIHATKAKLTAP